MTQEEAKEYIKNNAKSYYLQVFIKAQNGGYICPICNSGTHKDKTGALHIYENNRVICFAGGCFGEKGADVFDVIGKIERLTDYSQIFKRAYEIFNLQVDYTQNASSITASQPIAPKIENKQAEEETLTDYTEFYNQCRKNIDKTDYWEKRGISKKVIERFWIGYCENWISPSAIKKGKKPTPTPRLIIPTSKYTYLARDTRSNLNEKDQVYSKMKEGKVRIFNINSLKSKNPVFVVEGEIDALSIIEVGGEAVALGSTSNKNDFIEHLKENKPLKPLILYLDNDSAGRETQNRMKLKLQEMCIDFYEFDISPFSDSKDPNEALCKDRELFKAKVKEAIDEANKNSLTPLEKLELKSGLSAFDDYHKAIEKNKTNLIPTGFKALDSTKGLNGGLYAGLFILGAVTSMGKTMLFLNMAENIAQSEEHKKCVLYFTLEMSKYELMARTVSKFTAVIEEENGKTIEGKGTAPRTLFEVINGKHPEEHERELTELAEDRFRKFAHRFYYYEGLGEVTTEIIRNEVKNFKELKGEVPIVFVDYLQLLIPPKEWRGTDKQAVDSNVLALKQISRDFDTPVLAISSLNRESYDGAPSLSAFKESGAIEYGSDVLMMLDLDGLTNDKKKNEEVKVENRKRKLSGYFQNMRIHILKNRRAVPGSVPLQVLQRFNYFKDVPDNSEKL